MSYPYGGHGAHDAEVASARSKIEELRHAIALCGDLTTETMGAVLRAVGDDPRTESGRNAYEFVAGCHERLTEALTMAAQADAELERYRGGF